MWAWVPRGEGWRAAAQILWATGVLVGAVHSLSWSRRPLERAYARMIRQMSLLTAAQLALALSLA